MKKIILLLTLCSIISTICVAGLFSKKKKTKGKTLTYDATFANAKKNIYKVYRFNNKSTAALDSNNFANANTNYRIKNHQLHITELLQNKDKAMRLVDSVLDAQEMVNTTLSLFNFAKKLIYSQDYFTILFLNNSKVIGNASLQNSKAGWQVVEYLNSNITKEANDIMALDNFTTQDAANIKIDCLSAVETDVKAYRVQNLVTKTKKYYSNFFSQGGVMQELTYSALADFLVKDYLESKKK